MSYPSMIAGDQGTTADWTNQITGDIWKVHTYNYAADKASYLFTATSSINIIYELIAGGGGGGDKTDGSNSPMRYGGGGGAGGVSQGSLDINSGNSVTIVVGIGGIKNTNGGNTKFTYSSNTIECTGGGSGGDGKLTRNAGNGGSGGGPYVIWSFSFSQWSKSGSFGSGNGISTQFGTAGSDTGGGSTSFNSILDSRIWNTNNLTIIPGGRQYTNNSPSSAYSITTSGGNESTQFGRGGRGTYVYNNSGSIQFTEPTSGLSGRVRIAYIVARPKQDALDALKRFYVDTVIPGSQFGMDLNQTFTPPGGTATTLASAITTAFTYIDATGTKKAAFDATLPAGTTYVSLLNTMNAATRLMTSLLIQRFRDIYVDWTTNKGLTVTDTTVKTPAEDSLLTGAGWAKNKADVDAAATSIDTIVSIRNNYLAGAYPVAAEKGILTKLFDLIKSYIVGRIDNYSSTFTTDNYIIAGAIPAATITTDRNYVNSLPVAADFLAVGSSTTSRYDLSGLSFGLNDEISSSNSNLKVLSLGTDFNVYYDKNYERSGFVRITTGSPGFNPNTNYAYFIIESKNGVIDSQNPSTSAFNLAYSALNSTSCYLRIFSDNSLATIYNSIISKSGSNQAVFGPNYGLGTSSIVTIPRKYIGVGVQTTVVSNNVSIIHTFRMNGNQTITNYGKNYISALNDLYVKYNTGSVTSIANTIWNFYGATHLPSRRFLTDADYTATLRTAITRAASAWTPAVAPATKPTISIALTGSETATSIAIQMNQATQDLTQILRNQYTTTRSTWSDRGIAAPPSVAPSPSIAGSPASSILDASVISVRDTYITAWSSLIIAITARVRSNIDQTNLLYRWVTEPAATQVTLREAPLLTAAGLGRQIPPFIVTVPPSVTGTSVVFGGIIINNGGYTTGTYTYRVDYEMPGLASSASSSTTLTKRMGPFRTAATTLAVGTYTCRAYLNYGAAIVYGRDVVFVVS
jgi:hypothetical protein